MAVKDHIEEIAELRRQGESLQQIGDRYGVTCEYIRQILEPLGITPAPKPVKFPIRGLYTRMRQWLWDAGYRRCPCGIWSEKVTKVNRRCPECNRQYANGQYHDNGGRERAARYRRQKPQEMAAYHRKWMRKKCEQYPAYRKAANARVNERHKERYKTDPVFHERVNARFRERYRERYQSDPAFRQKELDRRKARYAQKKYGTTPPNGRTSIEPLRGKPVENNPVDEKMRNCEQNS